MLSMFPKPYNDELLYSIVSRYHRQSGNIETRYTLSDLFGEERKFLSSDFPTKLNVLFERLRHFIAIEPLVFLKEHTPYLYYTNFLSPEITEKIQNNIMSIRTNVHSSTGQMASTVKDSPFFKFCDLCAQEDFNQFGETYWRVSHQLPSVMICTKHGNLLKESYIRYRGGEKCQLHFASTENQINAKEIFQDILLTQEDLNHINDIALQSELLLKESFSRGKDFFRSAYFYLLKVNGYTSFKGTIYQTELREHFIRYFGDKILRLFQSYPLNLDSNWLESITRKHRKSFHPLRHILLLLFLRTPVQDFFNLEINGPRLSVFPFGPYKCLNKFCPQFNENVIETIIVKTCKDTKRPLGEFRCSTCGFTYTRLGPDLISPLEYSIRRIKDYGWLWRENLVEFVDKKELSYRATAREMGVDVNTVIKYYRLEKNSKDAHVTDEVDEDKLKWMELIRNNPQITKKALRELEPALFSRIYRKDKEWLKRTLPNNRKKVINNRVNWNERDKETLRLIKEYILNNRSEVRQNRITISFIGAKINKTSLLQKKLNKMPLCECFLKCLYEDFFELKIKKGKLAS
ncbi:hypothetical protein D1B31_19295 [Neobacillus notoginsengisoli]|uniref:Uncharacterized protein n=1 Tax=Neobacillus notoginsengisoli TaxID=1578198 RepID=A0A417YMR2_9BACI|nr:TnsD family Tn7-like transposition protein [Neobacillus notoginsengisoli]RHW34814.1 hypothetical protein D1B31_19295 [Neobacillus notoginsengisoli]